MLRPGIRLRGRNRVSKQPFHPNCGKRSREHTPPEVLSPIKEAKIAKQEAKEAAKAEVKDVSWR